MSESQPLSGTTNELAKERTRAAAERSMNAWVGNCIGLIGTGLAVDQINQSLRQRFPEGDLAMATPISHLVGLAFVGIGVVLLAIALAQHRLEIQAIERQRRVLRLITTLNHMVIIAILLFALAGLFIILFLI
ncbi:MAG: YidH family protein [Nodosilinea sp.]